MILNAKNSKIIFWAYKPYYAKKTRSGTAPVQNYDNRHHHHLDIKLVRSFTFLASDAAGLCPHHLLPCSIVIIFIINIINILFILFVLFVLFLLLVLFFLFVLHVICISVLD